MMRRCLWVVPVTVLWAGHAQTADLTGTVGAGVVETDNVYRTNTQTESDTIGEVLANLAFEEDTRLVEAKAASNLEFLYYDHDDYSSELLGNFFGTGSFAIVPERFVWVIQENFG
jgi:hypothetical protein